VLGKVTSTKELNIMYDCIGNSFFISTLYQHLSASALSLQNQGIPGDRKEKHMVYMAWTASKMVNNDYIWWSSFDGNTWSPPEALIDGQSSNGPALS
jgi:hypothetical protein